MRSVRDHLWLPGFPRAHTGWMEEADRPALLPNSREQGAGSTIQDKKKIRQLPYIRHEDFRRWSVCHARATPLDSETGWTGELSVIGKTKIIGFFFSKFFCPPKFIFFENNSFLRFFLIF